MRVVAFLRAINVGGNNRVAMKDLRAAFEEAGFVGVSTHLQTGNVLLDHQGDIEPLYDRLETLLRDKFGFTIPVVIRTREELEDILRFAPFDVEDDDHSHQFIALFRHPFQEELPPNPANGCCSYLLKTEREIYSQWWKLEGNYEIPRVPKSMAVSTTRNRRVLMAILEMLTVKQ